MTYTMKKLYGYKCQICGEMIGEEYGLNGIVEVHHIDYFVNILNNDFKQPEEKDVRVITSSIPIQYVIGIFN